MPVALLPVVLLLSLFASSGRGCIPTRTPEYIVDQEMWKELQKQTTSVLLTTVRESTAPMTSPSSSAPTTTSSMSTTTSSTTTTTTTTSPCPTTPAPWSYNSANGHCYYASTEREQNWQDAENNCNSYATDAHLASIADQDENDFVFSILGMGDFYWLGLRQPENGNTFTTMGTWTDNTMYDYVNGYSNWESPPTMPIWDLCSMIRGPAGANPGQWYSGRRCSQTIGSHWYVCEVPA